MKRFGEGLKIILNSISIFRSWPMLIVPLFLSWLVYAPSAIYFKYYYAWGQYSTSQNIFVAFGGIVLLSVTLCFSCSWLLEMLQDIEAGKSVSLLNTFKRVFFENFKAILPVAIIWAFLWFLLSVISLLLGKKDKDSDEELTAQSAAEALAGYESFSFSKAFIDALKKGIRMIVFLIMPAIAWENLGAFDAIKKGVAVFRARLKQFSIGYLLTYAASALVFLPAGVMFILGSKDKHGGDPLIVFSDEAWMMLIFYIGFAWSFSMYLEQMFTASLYMWHLKWESLCKEAKIKGYALPEFHDVQPPQILKTLPELKKFFKTTEAQGESGPHR